MFSSFNQQSRVVLLTEEHRNPLYPDNKKCSRESLFICVYKLLLTGPAEAAPGDQYVNLRASAPLS